MKARHLPACIAIALAFLGCATERPTTPPDITEMSAIPIGSKIVTRSSGPVRAIAETYATWSLGFDEVAWADSLQHGDIHITCSSYAYQVISDVYVVDPASGRLMEIEGALSWERQYCSPYSGLCYYFPNRLLSQVSGSLSKLMIPESHRIRLTSPNAWGYVGRLIDYDPLYESVTVRTQQDFGLRPGIGVFGDSVVVLSSFGDIAIGKWQDSVQVFNRLGEHQSSHALPHREARSILAGDGEFWIYAGSSYSHSLVCIGLDGSERHRFLWYYGLEIIPLYEASGILWIAKSDRTVAKIDIDASDSAGIAVIRSTVPANYIGGFRPSDLHVARHADGLVMTVSSISAIVTLDSEFRHIQSWVSPVLDPTAIASDGESVWILHHGPRGAYTDATLLTRFTLE